MRTILFDIDETLISNNTYPKELNIVKDKINYLKSNNYNIGICTARPFDKNVLEIMDNYSIDGPIIVENGACIYKYDKKFKKFIEKDALVDNIDLNKLINNLINNYNKDNKLDFYVNNNRKYSSTIKCNLDIEELSLYLKNNIPYQDYIIYNANDKIYIYNKNVNKINGIEKYFDNKDVILISDFEAIIPKHKSNIKIYSVGKNEKFNSQCNKVFSPFIKGVIEILEKEVLYMKEYEKLSENCKILWKENFEFNGEKHTQVSGYILNDDNQLLIVKNGKTWTIPGGHPENNETFTETLEREIMEEACVTIKDSAYLGAVEVVENDEVYYQVRYTARAKEILPFTDEWETCERKFVNINNLKEYISWSDGIMFSAQIDSVKKYWNIGA